MTLTLLCISLLILYFAFAIFICSMLQFLYCTCILFRIEKVATFCNVSSLSYTFDHTEWPKTIQNINCDTGKSKLSQEVYIL